MIRYSLRQEEVKYIYKTSAFAREDRTIIPFDSNNEIFVNILERKTDDEYFTWAARVKLFYANGNILEGWIMVNRPVFRLINEEELFDGRFNQ